MILQIQVIQSFAQQSSLMRKVNVLTALHMVTICMQVFGLHKE